MCKSNEELADELKGLLGQTGLNTAFSHEDEPKAIEEQNPLETDFFRAINAFRAARTQGDPAKIAAAEEQLRSVVRSELTGEGCEA